MAGSDLSDLSPGRLIIGALAVILLMGFGLLLFSMTGPSAEELAEAEKRRTKMEMALEQQRMIEASRHELYSNIDAADFGAAMSHGN